MWIVVVLLLVLLLATVAVLIYFIHQYFGGSAKPFDLDEVLKDFPERRARIASARKEFDQMPFEEVHTVSDDGLRLHADLYRAPRDEGRYLICMHGYHSTVHDFVCAVDFFQSQGFHILLVHQRAHGKSEGKWTTFGIKERYDCLAWCRYLNERFGEEKIKIVLDGLSMGATTVLLASELPLPKNVKGIMADCGFTSPWEIVCHVASDALHIPRFPLLYLLRPAVSLMADFDLKAASTVEAVKKCPLPILYIHGLADDFVPHEMSRRAYEARPENSYLVNVEGAGHGLSYVVDEIACQEATGRFLKEVIK